MKRYMKRKLVLLVCICVLFAVSYSQSDYRNGFIITNNNDTIYGLIDFRSRYSNSHECIFIKNNESDKTTYKPFDIQAYRFVDDKYYVSKEIIRNDTIKSIFLEFLLKGAANLYSYYDFYDGEHFYIDNNQGIFIELKNTKVEEYIDDTKYLREKKEYQGVLKYYFQEAPSVTSKTDNLAYGQNSLINLFKDYHDEVCSGEECISYVKKPIKLKFSLGPFIGFNIYTEYLNINYLFVNYYLLEPSDFNNSLLPTYGLYFNFYLPEVNQKLHFQYEVSYSKWRQNVSSVYYDSIFNIDYYMSMAYLQQSINNVFLFTYEFPKGKIRPLFQIGAFFNYFFIQDFSNNLTAEDLYGNQYTNNELTSSPFPEYQYGLCFAIGNYLKIYKQQEILFELRYSNGFGLQKDLNSQTIYLSVGVPLF